MYNLVKSEFDKVILTYLDSYKMLCPELTSSELEYVAKGVKIQELRAKQLYHKANFVQNDIGFVYEGLIRSFYEDEYGNEITVKFIREHSFVTDYPAFVSRAPSRYNFQCIEDVVLVSISYEHIQNGYRTFPKLERYGRLVAELYLTFQQRRIESFLFKTAEERYIEFIHEEPDLFNRVSLSHLSTYLGIERQTLTRIRSRIMKN